ncbi:MAG: hypothetical protein E6Z39_01350, partial [Varibaculum cambriense]|nr:hypothetical protein [Varibaculum cambriense]
KQARLNMIHHFLSSIPYTEIQSDVEPIQLPPRPNSSGYVRPSVAVSKYVPDFAGEAARMHKQKKLAGTEEDLKQYRDNEN